MWAPMGAASGLQRGTEGMPEMQKSVLEYAAPKANQNQGLESHLADESKDASALMQKAQYSQLKTSDLDEIIAFMQRWMRVAEETHFSLRGGDGLYIAEIYDSNEPAT
jgi:hypothetical protein